MRLGLSRQSLCFILVLSIYLSLSKSTVLLVADAVQPVNLISVQVGTPLSNTDAISTSLKLATFPTIIVEPSHVKVLAPPNKFSSTATVVEKVEISKPSLVDLASTKRKLLSGEIQEFHATTSVTAKEKPLVELDMTKQRKSQEFDVTNYVTAAKEKPLVELDITEHRKSISRSSHPSTYPSLSAAQQNTSAISRMDKDYTRANVMPLTSFTPAKQVLAIPGNAAGIVIHAVLPDSVTEGTSINILYEDKYYQITVPIGG